ncbi:MAG TPA: hypothetical protein VMJ10_05335 [Kofleriaceae bacterium]|nr:hypothetical protein [Kofleriaceae bacterium]
MGIGACRTLCVVALASASTTGCKQILGLNDLAPDASTTQMIDAPIGADADANCFGTLATVCVDPPSLMARTIAAAIDTDTGCDFTMPQSGSGGDLCVVAGTTVSVPASAQVAVTGSRPLVIVATDTIAVDGTLDASSGRGTVKGAAASTCASSSGTANAMGGGGGGGGSFGTAGGNGGAGETGASGGTASQAMAVTSVRGGCAGGAGGNGDLAGTGGLGGDSGGAVYLVAVNSIAIDATGVVLANGAGGSNPVGPECGGGGGGAGGLVALEAPTITVVGTIAANGGGGSEGTGNSGMAKPGTNGGLPYDVPAAGGSGGTSVGGDGGAGAAATTAAVVGQNGQPGGANGAGAGGGGGGAGIVWVKGSLTGTLISPPPTLH